MVYVACALLTCDSRFDRLTGFCVMRIGIWNVSVTAVLGLAISFVAKDLSVPLMGFALLGIVDRIVVDMLARSAVG